MGLRATIVTTAPFFPAPEGEAATEQQQTMRDLEKYFPLLVIELFPNLTNSVEDIEVSFELYPGSPDGILIRFDFAGQLPPESDRWNTCLDLQENLFKWLRSKRLQIDLVVRPA